MTDKMPLLRQKASSLGFNISEDQLSQFEIYYARLLEWNNRFNLTSITGYEEIQTRHFLDSLSVILANKELNNKKIIDVGTGAGFPGLALKIVFPDMHLTLLEATKKKTDFLTGLCEELQLKDVLVINDRAENIGHDIEHRENYDIAVSRAVASLDVLCELSLPFCRIGGHFIALKRNAGAEVAAASPALTLLGGRLKQCLVVNSDALPEGGELVIIEKTKNTPDRFPRRNGIPGKRPLR